MKRIVLFVCIVVSIAYLVSRVGKKNLANAKNIKIGMKSEKVIAVMGKPIDTFENAVFYMNYAYEAPIGYSDDIIISFTADTVVYIDLGH